MNGHDHALTSNTEKISARIGENVANTRAQLTGVLDANQEVMKQEISGLKRGLHLLQLVIDRKLEELKDFVIMINTTDDGPNRQSLKKKGELGYCDHNVIA